MPCADRSYSAPRSWRHGAGRLSTAISETRRRSNNDRCTSSARRSACWKTPNCSIIPPFLPRIRKISSSRVRELLKHHPHGTGAYTQSPGIPFIRQAVADFITARDGVASDKDHIILTDGASKGVQAVLLALLSIPGGRRDDSDPAISVVQRHTGAVWRARRSGTTWTKRIAGS